MRYSKLMLSNFFFLFIFISVPPALLAQQQGGSMGLEIMDVRTVITKSTIEKRAGEDFFRLNFELELEALNRTQKPWIVIGRAVKIVGIRAAESKESLLREELLLDRNNLPSFKNESIARDLTLQSSDVQIVRPREYYRQKLEYWVGIPDSFVPPPGRSLWLQFDVSFFPTNTMRIEGEALQKAWIGSGKLIIDQFTTVPTKACITVDAS